MPRQKHFGMPHFPERGTDLIGKIEDGIHAQGLIDFWGDACPVPNEQLVEIIEQGTWAEKEARDLLMDNRGDL